MWAKYAGFSPCAPTGKAIEAQEALQKFFAAGKWIPEVPRRFHRAKGLLATQTCSGARYPWPRWSQTLQIHKGRGYRKS